MSMSDFLKDLPSKRQDSFAKVKEMEANATGGTTNPAYKRPSSLSTLSRHRATVYVPTKDHGQAQVILNAH